MPSGFDFGRILEGIWGAKNVDFRTAVIFWIKNGSKNCNVFCKGKKSSVETSKQNCGPSAVVVWGSGERLRKGGRLFRKKSEA